MRFLARAMVMAALAFGLGVGTLVATPEGGRARAQGDALSAAVVRGDCDDPGRVAAELRPLTASEGGAWTSFTTIDLAVDEVTGGGYAVVVGEADAPAACGDLTGAGEDVFAAVPEANGSGLAGIAWLHALGDQTRVSLFAGEGRSGAQDGPPEPPGAEETPEPPDAPDADREVYTAPNHEYSIAYDPAQWTVVETSTQPGAFGPTDYLALSNPDGTAMAEFAGMQMLVMFSASAVLSDAMEALQNNSTVQEVAIRTDADGNELRGGGDDHAYLVLDVELTNAAGRQVSMTIHLEGWQIPAADAVLMMIYQTPQSGYEDETANREALVQGIAFPQ
jgi:hypothetical protein